MLTFRDATDDDFAAIVPLLRKADIEEWRVGTGKTPEDHLKSGYKLPSGDGCLNRVCLDEDGAPLILYGVNRSAAIDRGYVWLIATEQAPSFAIEFHRHWDAELDLLGADYPAGFYTGAWTGNVTHHTWLRWMGFKPWGAEYRVGTGMTQPYRYDRKGS